MTTELRMYTINAGLLDDWVAFYTDTLLPAYEPFGLRAGSAWTNRASNEFIWVRSYDALEAVDAWNASDARAALSDDITRFIAGSEIRFIESVDDAASPAATG